MKTLLVATQNNGKLKELTALLAPINIIGQAELDIPSIEETGLTFVENALLKARHASKLSGLPALADDSGLVVPALEGAPGIHSARYAGNQANDKDNIIKLLNEMQELKDQQREAFFYCTLVLIRHANDPMPLIASGSVKGNILTSLQGSGGFGYDPVFYLPQLQQTMAELDAVKKNRISHRGKALRLLTRELLNESI